MTTEVTTMGISPREIPDDMDRASRWHRRSLDLVEQQGLALIGLTCSDCGRVRDLDQLYRSPKTGLHHCLAVADCEATIRANNAAWSDEARAACDAAGGRGAR